MYDKIDKICFLFYDVKYIINHIYVNEKNKEKVHTYISFLIIK